MNVPGRVIDGFPGTFTRAFKPEKILEQPFLAHVRDAMQAAAWGTATPVCKLYRMGTASIIVDQEPAGDGGRLLWHMSISHPHRHPTWDEMKLARYTLLPHDITVAILLPPPETYVNVPEQDHVFHLWEVYDPRAEGAQ